MKIKYSLSIIAIDILHLLDTIKKVTNTGNSMLHIDIMDNHYVPNLTFGVNVCQSLLKKKLNFNLDVHLMASPADSLIEKLINEKIYSLAIHQKTVKNLKHSLLIIKQKNIKAGIVLNPNEDLNEEALLLMKEGLINFIIIMGVYPGFSGQVFIYNTVKKIAIIKEKLIRNNIENVQISVDGGVNLKNVVEVVKAGANILVLGGAVFYDKNPDIALQNIINKVESI